MKEVMAVIRMNMMNKTKDALAAAGISSFTATGRVLGRGKGKVDFRLVKGAEQGNEEAIALLGQGPKLVPKRLITVIVPDELASRVVETLISVNKTGNAGDGKIFVLPVFDAGRIRTGEFGATVLDE
ncbi:MAG: nitrogen fixation protein [Elusimicrobia bacterium RIFOXYA2_FULL_50_26]|nr:MAG: nitrogen fixation protein [Elusimicrobia bacterium RIFOXYA2_FULL_50_26]OGS24774.1 MAG: nitrogen fixation protein [Elusimicrobia bacterium RIFOXYB2_FULL_50_12]